MPALQTVSLIVSLFIDASGIIFYLVDTSENSPASGKGGFAAELRCKKLSYTKNSFVFLRFVLQ